MVKLTKDGLLRIHLRNGKERIFCNFNCSYCNQRDHKTTQFEKEKLDYMKEIWDKLSKIEDDIIVRINFNGELIVNPNAIKLLIHISNLRNVRYCEIITNNSINPKEYLSKVNKDKVSFNCSYHTEEIFLDKFLEHARIIKDAGCPILVNMVVKPSLVRILPEICAEFKRNDIPFKPSIMIKGYGKDGCKNTYTQEELEIIKEHYYSPEEYDHNFIETKGKLCYAGVDMINLTTEGKVLRCFNCNLGHIDDLLSSKTRLKQEPYGCHNNICHCYAHSIYMKEFRDKYELHPSFADHYKKVGK